MDASSQSAASHYLSLRCSRRGIFVGLASTSLLVAFAPVSLAQGGYKLGTGDKLKVVVFGEEDASGEYEVDATGAISARLLGRLPVKGLTV